MKSNRLSDYWKVPFREVYCETFRMWVASVIHCHITLRLNPFICVLLFALLAACLPAKADPAINQVLVANNAVLLPFTNTTPVTNLNLTYKIYPNSQLVFDYSVQSIGTNNAAGTVAFGHNFNNGDGQWTTTLPLSHTLTLSQSNTCAHFVVNYTNVTGEATGRLDSVTPSGSTNLLITLISVTAKNVSTASY